MLQSPKSILARVDGYTINSPDLADAIDSALDRAHAAVPFTVFTLNLDHLVKLRRNDAFRRAYANATIVTADGAPVAMLARRQDERIERTTGADMVLPLIRAAAASHLPIYLFGSSPDILRDVSAKLRELTHGSIDIRGAASPSLSFNPEGAEADAALDAIKRSGARLCFVALGAPKQEVFAERARAEGIACGMVCIGAALDFIVGAQTRAPLVFQKTGLEWAWRLASNPRRLAKRYLDSALLFAGLLLKPSRN
ncbi:glycosyltransferase [Hyphomicrobium methylovorum]|nr:glycosyltransferase [Hyphomicrobium methylovorum]